MLTLPLLAVSCMDKARIISAEDALKIDPLGHTKQTPIPTATVTPITTASPNPTATGTSSGGDGKDPPHRSSKYGEMSPRGYDGKNISKKDLLVKVVILKNGTQTFTNDPQTLAQSYVARLNTAVTVDGYRYLHLVLDHVDVVDDAFLYIPSASTDAQIDQAISYAQSHYGEVGKIVIVVCKEFTQGILGVASEIFQTLPKKPTFLFSYQQDHDGLTATLPHEVGHLFGLRHTAYGESFDHLNLYNWETSINASGTYHCPNIKYFAHPQAWHSGAYSYTDSNQQVWDYLQNTLYYSDTPFGDSNLTYWNHGYEVAFSHILGCYYDAKDQ